MFSQYVQLLMVRFNSQPHTRPRQVYRALEKLYTNTFSVITEELMPIAEAVYPTASMINHSCRSNCVQHFSGRKITIRAIDRVEVGEEVTVSYIDVIQGVEERRANLVEFRFKKVIYYSPPIKSSTVNEMDMNLGVESILSCLLEDHLAPSVVRLAPCSPRKLTVLYLIQNRTQYPV